MRLIKKEPLIPSKPITARPVGKEFVVLARGYKLNWAGRAHTSTGDGCFRRLPTCKE